MPSDANTIKTTSSEAGVPSSLSDAESQENAALSDRETRHTAGRFSLGAVRSVPAMLISLIVHTALFLLLALWHLATPIGSEETFSFQATHSLEPDSQPTTQMLLAAGAELPPPSPVQDDRLDAAVEQTTTAASTISDLLKVEAPERSHEQSQGALDRLMVAASIAQNASFSSTGVEGRSLQKRRDVALARGGTIKSEQAVERALEWLAAHQRPSGAWSLIHDTGPCNGQCRNNGSKDRFDTAATGLSLLAFLGAGYTHKDGKHRETVRRGVYFLLQVIEERPEGGSFLYQSDRGMYNHGIAAFALCEAFQMTGDQDLRQPAQQAIDFIVSAQNYRGGWGYLPKQPGDLTLSGWQVMALKSAFAAGLNIPPSTIIRIDSFLDSQQVPSGVFYGYGKPERSPTCTAIGQLLRLFRGMTHTDPRVLDAAVYFRKVGRSNSDVYHNYYVSLFLFHVGGRIWDDWNPTVREHLIATQSTYGHESGSWYFENPYGKEGGRLYTTAMCAMTLEVYYRFAPLYQQADRPFKL